MKTTYFTCCLILFLFIALPNAYAQETQHFGVKGGTTVSTLTNLDNLNLRPGFQLGAFGKFGGGESIFFKAEFLVTQKGALNWSRNRPDNFSLYYVDVPVMFGIDIFRNFSLNLGIQPSVLVTGTYRSAAEGNTSTRFIGGDLTRFDYSTLIGFEYFVRENWLLGLRYNHGWVPIQTYYEEFTLRNNNQLLRNRILQVYVGFVLR